MATLDNPYVEIDLRFRQGEPLSWSLDADGADWSGSYDAQIVNGAGVAVAELTVTATHATTITTFEIQLTQAESETITPGSYRWAARASTGEVRLRGIVTVDAEAVPVG